MPKKNTPAAPSAKSKRRPPSLTPVAAPPADNSQPSPTGGPQFAEPIVGPDPSKFVVKHGSDSGAYKILDATKQSPRPFPIVNGVAEPIVTLADALGASGASIVSQIQSAGQIVFHSVGDTGSTRGPFDEDLVTDKLVSDFTETDPAAVPSFFYHLGDVVYSFGESQYYYDQFYDPFRDYPAPVFAIPGNHDGMVAPQSTAKSLDAFLQNFCQAGIPAHRTPEAGGLARTAQVQPAVYFTLEAPFVRILGLYSNSLEDPGVISTENGRYPYLTDVQLTYLQTALARVKKEKFPGAVLIAVHHPPYVAILDTGHDAGKHGNNPKMLKDIDAACEASGVLPHALLCGHAHNYQRFTRNKDGRQTPFIVAGDGGHGMAPLTRKGQPAIRVPVEQPPLSDGSDKIMLENYDDQDFGYLRILVNAKQLRLEYHPATDGAEAKTPDDHVTIDIAQRVIVPYLPPPAK